MSNEQNQGDDKAHPVDTLVMLACPFCGTKPTKRVSYLDERFSYANLVVYACPKCGCEKGARGDTSKDGYADNSTVEKRAAIAWNTRAM